MFKQAPFQIMKLPLSFYLRENTIEVSRDLLGKLLVVPDENGDRVSGMIVETEAYLGEIDKGAHSYGGRRTARNEITYAEGGHVYVFFVYGMYYQLNFVTGPAEHPHVCLIRAVEPVEGIETMRKRRGKMPDKNLTSGPGKLCIAFGIDRSLKRPNPRRRIACRGDRIEETNAVARQSEVRTDRHRSSLPRPFQRSTDDARVTEIIAHQSLDALTRFGTRIAEQVRRSFLHLVTEDVLVAPGVQVQRRSDAQ